MAIACLYKGRLFLYWLHHEIPRRRCLAARRQTKGRRTSDSSQRYWCSFVKIALHHLSATSHMHIRSLGLTSSWESAFYAPSSLRPGASWGFSFTHPKSLYVIVSIYFSFIHSFQMWIPMICRLQPYVQVDNKLSKSNCVFSVPDTVTSPTLQSR